jgi:hypothetical protein
VHYLRGAVAGIQSGDESPHSKKKVDHRELSGMRLLLDGEWKAAMNRRTPR